MYLSVDHISIKLGQDRTKLDKDLTRFIICDGIGSLKESATLAELVVDHFDINPTYSLSEYLKYLKENLKTISIPHSGTTIIIGNIDRKTLKVEYLGNGGGIHFHGDFAKIEHEGEFFRYCNFLVPHIDSSDALTRHFSNQNSDNHLIPGEISLDLNYHLGNIVLLFSDGISSLEQNLIVTDEKRRYWRVENSSIQRILQLLNEFLTENCESETFQDALNAFCKRCLQLLERDSLLNDDASLAIVLTPEVLEYYANKS